MGAKGEVEIVIYEKSLFQKEKCLFCPKKATHEARIEAHKSYGPVVRIRCCIGEQCQRSAIRCARASFKTATAVHPQIG